MLKKVRYILKNNKFLKENLIIIVIIWMTVFGFVCGYVVKDQLTNLECKIALNTWSGSKVFNIPLDNFSEVMTEVDFENKLDQNINIVNVNSS